MELTLTSWAVAMGGLWVLFSRSEKVASPDAKKAITRWLKNVKMEGTPTAWPSTFASVFDSIFGKKHLSWRCFVRSWLASVSAVAFVVCIWGALRPDEFSTWFHSRDFYPVVPGIIFLTCIINVVPDYISLLETRYVIRWMGMSSSTGRILTFLIIDLAVTSAIGASAIFAFMYLAEGSKTGIQRDIFFLTAEHEVYPVGIYFYSTFFTSVWVWLYAISGLVVKLEGYLGIGFSRLKWFLDIENKPLHSLGVISMLLVTLIYLGAGFYRLVGSS